MALVAIGQPPNPIIQQTTEGLTKLGIIEVNEETMQTKVLGIYAGGDVVLDAQRSSAPWKPG